MHELLPAATTVGMLLEPTQNMAAIQAAANSLGLKVIVAETTVEGDLEAANDKAGPGTRRGAPSK